jgi:hypothetical protein
MQSGMKNAEKVIVLTWEHKKLAVWQDIRI